MGETTNDKEHLKALLESFDTAMLITHHGEREHARPMAVAKVDGAETIWFVTSSDSPKVSEIQDDARVAATFQSERRFVALSGTAELVKDPAKVRQLWRPTWKVWFPDGKDDPKLVLIRVNVTDAEFWDNTGVKGVRYVFEAAKALVRHTRPSVGKEQHGRVKEAISEPPPPPPPRPPADVQQPSSQRH